jgi:hypothetical protein
MYEQLVALEYPNGRTHICTVTNERELDARDEFDMFGRTWRVRRIHRPKRTSDPAYLVCTTVAGPLAPLRPS